MCELSRCGGMKTRDQTQVGFYCLNRYECLLGWKYLKIRESSIYYLNNLANYLLLSESSLYINMHSNWKNAYLLIQYFAAVSVIQVAEAWNQSRVLSLCLSAGCLSVPLFNQRKRSRLPLTSNPSENDLFTANHYNETQSSTPALPSMCFHCICLISNAE